MATALMIGCAFFGGDSARIKYLETSVGEQSSVKLARGSMMVLNTDSSVRMRVDGPANTHAEILRGEAFFRVPRNLSGDLTVSVNGLSIDGQDSAFAVRLTDAGDVQVTVAEGQVQLSGTAEALLRGNQQTTVSHRAPLGEIPITDVTSVVISRELSWVKGVLVFNGTQLSNAVREINRYNLTRIEVADPGVGNERVGGTFSAFEPFAFVESVTKVYPWVRWACERGVSGTLVLRLRLASGQPGAGGRSPGCASVTFSAGSRGVVGLDTR